MKKILGLGVVAILVMAMVGGGTWAYFSDTESSTGNAVTAGTLDLIPSIDGTAVNSEYQVTTLGNGVDGKVVFPLVEPGSSGTITWALNNNGNLPGTLTIASTVTPGDGAAANEPEGAVTVPYANNDSGNGDLDDFMGVKLQVGFGTDNATAIGDLGNHYLLGSAGAWGALSGLQAALNAESRTMTAASGSDNDTIVYRFSWNIASDIVTIPGGAPADDNIIQGDTATVDITFTLAQS